MKINECESVITLEKLNTIKQNKLKLNNKMKKQNKPYLCAY